MYFGLSNLSESELKSEQRFRTHVGKFQRFINGIIDRLGQGTQAADEIVDVLRLNLIIIRNFICKNHRLVGRQHASARSMSFTAEKWLIFKNVLLSLLCRDSSVIYQNRENLLLTSLGKEIFNLVEVD